MVYKFIHNIEKMHRVRKNKAALKKREGFINSLNPVQKSHITKVKDMLYDYRNCLAFRYADTIVIQTPKYLCSITMYASESRLLITETNENSVKHSETRYFNDDSRIIFELMLEECLAKKHRDFVEKRDTLIS